jgi:hypothetical protein
MSDQFKFLIRQSLILPRVFVMLFIMLVLCELSWAQYVAQSSSQGKHLGLYFSTGIASYREDLLVPLGFHGPGISLGGNYTHRTENNSIDIRLKLGMGYLKNRYSHEAWMLMMELRPSWLKKLVEHSKYGDFWGGISIPLQMNNLFLESWDEAHLYWLTAHSLAFATEWQKQISQKFNSVVRIEIPILGCVSRPPIYRYNKQDALNHFSFHFSEPNKSLHFETLDTYRSLFIQMLFKREIQRSILHIGLEFQYKYCRTPRKIWGLNTSILLSYQWRIGS